MIVVDSEQELDAERRADDRGVRIPEEDAHRALAIQTEGAGVRRASATSTEAGEVKDTLPPVVRCQRERRGRTWLRVPGRARGGVVIQTHAMVGRIAAGRPAGPARHHLYP